MFLAVSSVTFTPLVIEPNKIEPTLGGLPYTLWTSILIGFGLLGLTYLGTRVHPRERDTTEQQQ